MEPERRLGIRARSDRDLDEIVSWVADAEELHLFSGPRLQWPLTADQLQAIAATHGLAPFVVVSTSDEVVAHFDLDVDGQDARLGRVIVKPGLRGRGLAGTVVQLAIGQARRLGAADMSLSVIATNEPAIRTYPRAGFAVHPESSPREDVIVMGRSLTGRRTGGRVLVTGMSGVGKSILLARLAERGHPTVDTDYDGWVLSDGTWDEPRMAGLLSDSATVVVAGTVENQGRFYDRFNHVVLLSAPIDVLIERVSTRATNPYGRSPHQQAEIRRYATEVEPLLRATADLELDGRRPVDELADAVELLLDAAEGSPT